jgi:hypothetical protein
VFSRPPSLDDLRLDGVEQPLFFLLTFGYAKKGQGYKQTIESGTEAYLRELLTNGGIPGPTIDNLGERSLTKQKGRDKFASPLELLPCDFGTTPPQLWV